MEDVKTRLEELFAHLSMTQAEFADKVGVSVNAVTNWKSRGIKGSAFEKIATAFPEVNMNWLKTGAGSMITSANAEISYKAGVPYYDVDFLGGFDIVFNDQTAMPSYYINFKPFEKATCWCNITGHSMEPEIHHGDIIALREIEDFSFLPYGETYAIVTKNDMRTVKKIGPGDTRDTYKLIPANKSGDYAPQEIKKKDILHVFEVMGCIKKF